MSGSTQPRGRPRGSNTGQAENAHSAATTGKRKRNTEGTQPGQGRSEQQQLRANAQNKFYTRMMLPGYKKRLPAAAQELVETALLDHDLADAPADDRRWHELYGELQRLVQLPSDASTSTPNTTVNNDDRSDTESVYEWGSSCDEDSASSPRQSADQPTSEAERPSQPESHLRCILPNPTIAAAAHRCISEQLTNKKGGLPKDVDAESWDPNSLAALSILIEEIVKSQARFNAQRTMFAKSPRNQALAAKRDAKKKSKDEDGQPANEQG